jgi:diguanylate cyclase (GGDEF)-like protein
MMVFVVFLLVLAGTMMAILAMLAFQRRSSQIAIAFALCCLGAMVWNFAFAAEILNTTLAQKILWANIQFLAISFLPVAWLALTLYSTAQSRQILRAIPALAIIPVITNLVVWTDPIYHLFRQNPQINTAGVPFPVLLNHYGPYFFAVHASYSYLLFAVSLVLLGHAWRKAPALYRRQRLTLLLSLLVPLLIDTLYVLGITPIPAFNFASIFFSLSALILAVNVLSLRFLDVVPLAYETAVNEMNVGLVVLDGLYRVSYLNPAAETITGIQTDQAVGADLRQMVAGFAPLWSSPDGKAEVVLPVAGVENVYQLHSTVIRGGRGRLVGRVITLYDITERVRLHQQVEKLSITDPLTDALNRRALTMYGGKEVQAAHRYKRSLSLMMLDVDDFKDINDRLGHPHGDEILKAMVETIQMKIRSNDLIFRYGGDEFVVLLHETGREEALKTAQRIHAEMARLSFKCEQDCDLEVLISLGITCLEPGDTLDSLLQRADQAMYQAKAAGKNQIVLK